MRASATIFLVLVLFSSCVRRNDRNSDCKWPDQQGVSNPNEPASSSRLRADVEFAEELAIRYMDAHRGPQASQTLNTCMGQLFEQIGKSHNMSASDVRKFLGSRSVAMDIALNLPFLILYSCCAGIMAVRLFRRYPPQDNRIVTLVMASLSSLAFGFCGMLVGEEASILIENIRVGSGHLSYRLNRLPWVRHETVFFVLCVALFWGVIGLCSSRNTSVWLERQTPF